MKVCFFLCAVVLLTACDKTPVSGRRTFAASGWVRELEPDGRTVVIQHEAISNYMGAMTMPFEVHDPNELRGLKPGDSIAFQLVVTSTDGWVEHITPRMTPLGISPAPAPATVQISRAVEPLDVGDPLPDYHFTNELGQVVDLSQYKGQAFAFTFFFTSCPFPNFCPRLTGNFAEAAALLRRQPDAPAQWHLFSISFDPKNDSPARLLAYAQNAHYDPAHWSFLTGAKDQISELADQFGENFWSEGGSISHNLRTVVINSRGRVQKIYEGNRWTAAELAGELTWAAHSASK